jgi:hypothetical protein
MVSNAMVMSMVTVIRTGFMMKIAL